MQLNNIEFENLRHLIIEEQAAEKKSKFFAQQASNQQLKTHLNQKVESCQQNIQRLNQFLNQY